METTKHSADEKSGVEQAGDDLFNFAIDREDVKWLVSQLQTEDELKRSKVEYELQILKIISIGWSISYFLKDHPAKNSLAEFYWKAIHELSQGISASAGLMAGQEIDYFQTLKDRLNMYVNAMARTADAPEPAAVIGPEFAEICGDVRDIHAVLTGTRLFKATIGSVKEYLETVPLM